MYNKVQNEKNRYGREGWTNIRYLRGTCERNNGGFKYVQRHNYTFTHNLRAKTLHLPLSGTSGHTEYARIWNSTLNATATWQGYQSDWRNITFNDTFTLVANKTYNYTIRTGSYPQIIDLLRNNLEKPGEWISVKKSNMHGAMDALEGSISYDFISQQV